jgi:3-hydroxyacyl-CoA dehydrogenase/enoyl-CoA hydratase/3-hydroxybutyryl-CoA epimerase
MNDKETEFGTTGDPEGSSSPQTDIGFRQESRPGSVPPVGVRLEVDEDGLGWLLFDLPGQKINALNTPVMDALRSLLDEAARRKVRGLIFASDKPDMFIAGADVDEIAGVTDPRQGMEKSSKGQALFETIAQYRVPTAAVITGPCLGGGYELALACTYRVAENAPSVRIGLPEVKLGIIPGFGGTQRLPRRVGLPASLDLILAGKILPAKPAFRRGMVDALVPPGRGREIAGEVLLGRRPLTPRRPARMDRVLARIPFLRNFALNKARQALSKKARRDHYPAPFMALEAVEAGFAMHEVSAFRNEARLVGEAVASEISKNLIWLFKASGEAKKPEAVDLEHARDARRLAVVGAGIMGGGIAWLAAENRLPIRVKDIAPPALDSAMETAGGIWAKSVKRRRLTPLERDRRLEQLSFTLDYTGFNTVDVALEAVVENLEVKRKVVAELEKVLPPQAVVASNTSSLRIADIAAEARNPERVVGLHFFNPVHRMPLVEVVAGPRSDGGAVATVYRLALGLGKTPILVKDGPGFLVNRLLAFYLGEALQILESGADPAQVDRLLTRFGMPMGPFELLDQIGLDVAEKVTHVMSEAYGDRLPVQATLGRLVAEGHLGKKSNQGFYGYERGRRGEPSPDAMRAAGLPIRREFTDEDVVDRLVLPMVNEASRCLDEGVVSRPLDVDLGMVMGTGFPPFRGGLLRYADHRGVQSIVDRLDVLGGAVDGRLAPSDSLRQRVSGFY